MSIKFCQECGSKLEYKYNPPKFCSNCGSPTGATNTSVATAKPTPQKQEKIRALNDDETDAEFVPTLQKLEFEIEDYSTSMTLGSLMGKEAPKTKRRNQTKSFDDFLDGGN